VYARKDAQLTKYLCFGFIRIICRTFYENLAAEQQTVIYNVRHSEQNADEKSVLQPDSVVSCTFTWHNTVRLHYALFISVLLGMCDVINRRLLFGCQIFVKGTTN